METNKNAFLVGCFVIIAILAGLGFTLWLTAGGKGKSVHYQIHFSESVGGLKIGSTVKFRGVTAGTVESMGIDPKDTQRVRVDVELLENIPIKADTVAVLKIQGFTGDMYIDLSGGDPKTPDLADISSNDIPEIRSEPSDINAIMNRLPQILEEMDHLLERANHTANQINKLFSDQNVKSVSGMIRKLSQHFGIKENQEDQ